MLYGSHNMSPTCPNIHPKWTQVGLRWAQDGCKISSRWLQDCTPLPPRCLKDTLKTPKTASERPETPQDPSQTLQTSADSLRDSPEGVSANCSVWGSPRFQQKTCCFGEWVTNRVWEETENEIPWVWNGAQGESQNEKSLSHSRSAASAVRPVKYIMCHI